MAYLSKNDRVTYTLHHIRYNHVDSERAKRIGTVSQVDIIDGSECAQVLWDGELSNVGFWVRVDLLRKSDE